MCGENKLSQAVRSLTLHVIALLISSTDTIHMNQLPSPVGLSFQKSKGPGIAMDILSLLFFYLFSLSVTLKQSEYFISNMLHSPFR